MTDNEKFEFTYVAPTEEERREIEDIRKLYDPSSKKESKMDRLRKLNAAVVKPPKIIASVIGAIGILLFGLGLTCILEWSLLVWGIIAATAGAAVMGANYPAYKTLLSRNKRKHGQEILELSKELLNENEK